MNHFNPIIGLKVAACLLLFTCFTLQNPLFANDPCSAYCYDFTCTPPACTLTTTCAPGADFVPCGNGANTGPNIDVDAAGPTTFPLAFPGSPCGDSLQLPPSDYVAWVTFVIQGSSFEWQLVETGGDDVYYEFYYSNLPEDDPNACSDLTFYQCGDDFSSWELVGSPSPNQMVRMYVAMYSMVPDTDVTVNLKFRKACGEACTNSDIAVVAEPDTCVNGSQSAQLSAVASNGGGGPYAFLWSPNDGSIDTIDSPTPIVTPAATTTYYVQAIGADGCPAYDSVRVQVGGCCSGPPVIVCPPDYNGCVGESIDTAYTGVATHTFPPDCWPAIISYTDDTTAINACGTLTVIRTWRAQDPDFVYLFDTCDQLITLSADLPTITCPANGTVTCSSAISVNATDANATADCNLGFSVGVSLTNVNGPPDCDGTIYTYTYTVTDDCGQTASCDQTFTIQNNAPTISCTAGRTVTCFSDITVATSDATATVSCGSTPAVVLSGPLVNGDPDCPGTTYTYTYSVTDACGRTASCDRVFTIDNAAPTISCPAGGYVECYADIMVDAANATATVSCGTPYVTISGPIRSGSMECPGETHTYTYTVTDACGRTASCQQVFTIRNDGPTISCLAGQTVSCASAIAVDPTDVTFTVACELEYKIKINGPVINGTPNCSGSTYTYTYVITDDCGREASCERIFTIDNAGPSIVCPADKMINCSSEIDADIADAMGSTSCGISSNIVLTGPVISGSPDCPGTVYTYKYTITDACGRTAFCKQQFTIRNASLTISCPADRMVSCFSAISVNAADATLTGNCITASGIVISGPVVYGTPDCNGTTYTYTYSVTDACGRSASCDQVFTIQHAGPTISCPADMTVACSDDIVVDVWNATGTTACGLGSNITIGNPVVYGRPDCDGTTYTYTYTIIDDCGGTASCDQVFTIQNGGPTITCPADMTVACSNDIVVDVWNATTTTSCSLGSNLTLSNPVIYGRPDCDGTTYTYTYTIVDDCGQMASCDQVFTIQNGGPTITCPADMTVACSNDIVVDVWNATTTTSCNLGSNLTLSNPVIYGRPDCDGTTYTYTYTITDSCGQTASCDQVFTIQNGGPTITCPADMTVACSNDIVVDVWNATTTTACYLGSNLTLSSPVLNGRPDCNGTTYTYTYTVTDSCGQTASCDQVFTIHNGGPTITCPADMTVECAADIVVDVWNATATTACYLGSDLTLSNPVVNGDPGCDGTTYTYTYTVTDSCGQTASCDQVFTIENDAPTITCPADMTVSCSDDIDPHPSDATVHTSCQLGFSLNISGPVIYGSGCNGVTYTYTYTGTDNCGRTVSCQQVFTLDSSAPPVPPAAPADMTIQCDDVARSAVDLTAQDDCDGAITVSPTEETFPGTCVGTYTMKRTWTFTDACNNSSSISQFIYVQDTTPPVFTDVPADLDVCGPAPAFGTPTVDDNCSMVSLTMSDQTIWGNCQDGEQKIRTWTATDECGNSSTASQSILFYHDDQPPVIVDCPIDLTVDLDANCRATATWTPPTATDNCGVLALAANYNPGDNFPAGVTTVTYTAIDNCGNESECSFTVTVNGNALILHCPEDIYESCDQGIGGAPVHWDWPRVTSCDANSCTNTPDPIAGFVYMGEFNGSHYYCSEYPATWPTAKTISQNEGGHLAVINSAQENAYLTSLLGLQSAYIGLTDELAEGSFEWVNGDPVTFTNWIQGQPSNSNNRQHYVELFGRNTSYAGKWNDHYVHVKREFIMEIPCSSIDIVQTAGPAKGSVFPVGITQVCYRATDSYGNSDECCFNVEVSPFSIHCPYDLQVRCASGQTGTYVQWNPPYVESCDVDCSPGNSISGFVYMGEYNGHHYYCSEFPATWNEAKTFAANSGGYLAVIDDAAENTYLANLLTLQSAYIGLSDEAVEGSFEWVNGEAMTFSNWIQGQPSNTNNLQHYVEIFGRQTYYAGKWNDQYGHIQREFIMEVPSCTTISQVDGPTSGSWLEEGSYEIVYRIEDASGNEDYCRFNVHVNCPDVNSNYCYNLPKSCYYNWIHHVGMGAINNTSGPDGGYGDYTNMETNVRPGYGYYLSLYPGFRTNPFPVYWRIWIDFNQDGDFDDYGEMAGQVRSDRAMRGVISIPPWCLQGYTRMRIAMSYYGYPSSACSAIRYGEVEDYTLYIGNRAPDYVSSGRSVMAENDYATFEPEDLEEAKDFVDQTTNDNWTFSVDETIAVPSTAESLADVRDVLLFPNPVREKLTVNLLGFKEQVTVKIHNKLGQLIYHQSIAAVELSTIDVTDLPAGIYYLSAEEDGHEGISRSFVVQR